MRPPVPQTNFNALTDVINAHMRNGAGPGEFELRRLEREIQKVKDVSALQGWKLSAMLASVTWNKEKVLHDTAVALKLAPQDINTLLLVGQCLWNSGLFDQAVEVGERAYELAPNNAQAVTAAIENAMCFGNYDRAVAIQQAAQSMGVSLGASFPDVAVNVNNLAAMNLSLDRVRTEASMALAVMAAHKIRVHMVRSRSWKNPEVPENHFVVIYVFHGTLEQEMMLEKALVGELIDDQDWDPNRLSTEFMALPTEQ